MMIFICLFFPSMLGLEIYNKKNKRLKLKDNIFLYVKINLIVNVLCMLISLSLNHFEIMYVNNNFFTFLFSVKYIMLASVISIIIPYVKDNINIDFKLERKKKIEKKKKFK